MMNLGGVPVAPFTTTVNGPAVAFGSVPLLATTLYANDVVPVGGVPLTAPVVEPMVRKLGAPEARANVGAGVPVAWKVYEYGADTVAVNGGESTVNFGAVLVAPFTTTVNGAAVAFGSVPLLATTLYANDVVPVGGVPLTAPVVEPMVRKLGAPEARANVGAGVPVAWKVYEYGADTVAVNGGESTVNFGAVLVAP